MTSKLTKAQEAFLQARRYLTGVTADTERWYGCAFTAFHDALHSKAAMQERVIQMRQRGVRPSSINTWITGANAFHRWMHQERGQQLIVLPKIKAEQRIVKTLNGEDIRRLVSYRPTTKALARIQVFVLLALDCGARCAELLAARWLHADFENLLLKLVQGKGQKQRMVPLSSEGRKLLFKWRQQQQAAPHDLIFATRNRTPLVQRNVLRSMRWLAEEAGINRDLRFSPHTLRHSFARWYIQNGGGLFQLQRVLGHTSPQTTQKYLRSLDVSDLTQDHSLRSALAAHHG